MVMSNFPMGLSLHKPSGHRTLHGSVLDSAAWEILSRPEEWNSPACRRDWQELVDTSDNLNLIYQSPDWFDHLQQTGEERRLALAVCRDKSGRTIALAPLRIARFPFRFHVRGNTFGTLPTLQLFFLGGGPLGRHDPSLLDELLRAAMHVFPDVDGFGFNPVQAETSLWKYLNDSRSMREDLFPYVIDGVQQYHVLPLPQTYTEYSARRCGKKRYNLKRQVRILREHGGGDLELRRIEQPEDLAFYLDALTRLGLIGPPVGSSIETASLYPRMCPALQSIAERGMLRSYALTCGGSIVGCIHGSQYRDIFAISDIRFDPEYSRFSPGVVMLHLAIEDVMSHRPARLINFGFGEPNRTHHQSNVILDYGLVVLLRNTFANRIRWACHRSFRSSVSWIKKTVPRARSILPYTHESHLL
jgi:Acetyltransferase (GNAT) domain